MGHDAEAGICIWAREPGTRVRLPHRDREVTRGARLAPRERVDVRVRSRSRCPNGEQHAGSRGFGYPQSKRGIGQTTRRSSTFDGRFEQDRTDGYSLLRSALGWPPAGGTRPTGSGSPSPGGSGAITVCSRSHTVPPMAESTRSRSSRIANRPPRGAVIVVAVGLFATLAAAALANENLSGEAAQLEWVQTKDPARLQAGRRAGRRRQDAAHRCRTARHRHQRQRLRPLPQFGDAADRRRRAGRQRPHPLLDARSGRYRSGADARAARLLPALERRPDRTARLRSLAGRIQLARHRARCRRNRRPPRHLRHRAGDQARMADLQDRARALALVPARPARPRKTWCCPSRRSGKRRRSPRSRSPAP